MEYKSLPNRDFLDLENASDDESGNVFVPAFSYKVDEWRTKIQQFLDLSLQPHSSIIDFFIYIYFAPDLEYDLLLESQVYSKIISMFASLSKILSHEISSKTFFLLPNEKMNIVYCILILRRFFKSSFFLEKAGYNNKKFIHALIHLSFMENVFYRIHRVSESFRCLAIDALKIVKHLFEFDSQMLLLFDQKHIHKSKNEVMCFSEGLWNQYISGNFIEIKLSSLELFIPWMRIIPGNQRTFKYFAKEIDKILNKRCNTFLVTSIRSFQFSKKAKTSAKCITNINENLLLLLDVLLNGEYQFLSGIETNEEEEVFDPLTYALDFNIINHVKCALAASYEPVKYTGFKIINRYLKLQKIPAESAIKFVESIKDQFPRFILDSERICKEVLKMMKYYAPLGNIYSFVLNEQFFESFHSILDDKEEKWKMHMISFIARVLLEISVDDAANLFELCNIAELLGCLENFIDKGIVCRLFDGIYRLINAQSEYQEILISQGIIEELESFLNDDEFAEKAGILLSIMHPTDA